MMVAGCPVRFNQTHVRNREHLGRIYPNDPIQSVVDFAGLNAVSDSVSRLLPGRCKCAPFRAGMGLLADWTEPKQVDLYDMKTGR